jgi:hypothetical protein
MGNAHHVIISTRLSGRMYIYANDFTFSMIEKDRRFEASLRVLDCIKRFNYVEIVNARIVNETGRHSNYNTEKFSRVSDGSIRNFVIRELEG